ncbi:tyrosine-protein phosphatase [Lactobacillus sp. PV034]|uniref:tyrosine-protein phosphatase n=1 Tax=Lactobacillus sp. PV034 TaxID=2594495 RepID=UPI00223F04DF|nr:tyrosine-protein phosphatase [Lactobacillus sp. PV034]QNQ81230.1 tyrosine-protein phosphatase [Lactobacillus sp. PV034]
MTDNKRLITFDGTVNFRDIGGYQGASGKKTKWHKIYRADSLSSLSDNDQVRLTEMGVVIDCDLRSTHEQTIAPDKLWEGAKYLDCHVYAENSQGDLIEDDHQLDEFLHQIPKVEGYLGQIYQNVLLSKEGQAAFRQVFVQLLNLAPDKALVYHCSAGKDRTGMVTALILTGLGVDDKTIAQDYLLTNELFPYGLRKQIPSDSDMIKLVNRMNVTAGEGRAIKGITQTLRDGFGGFDIYFTKILGFTQEDLKKLRSLYLE